MSKKAMIHNSKSEKETKNIAKNIAKKINNGGLVLFYGDLGTGKTLICREIAKNLGIQEFTVKSPTYTYIRKYCFKNKNLFHIDLYRFKQIDQLMIEEINELVEVPGNTILIEWADRLNDYFSKDSKNLEIRLKYIDKNTREIEIYESTKD